MLFSIRCDFFEVVFLCFALHLPRSVDLGFLIIRPLRGRWGIIYIITNAFSLINQCFSAYKPMLICP